jgi:hypothetical protein
MNWKLNSRSSWDSEARRQVVEFILRNWKIMCWKCVVEVVLEVLYGT